MKHSLLLPLALLLLPSQAHAERLLFDHRLNPALKAVLDSGRQEMVEFNDSNPSYVTDRIAVQGKSAADWSEELLIISRSSTRAIKAASDWLHELQGQSGAGCKAVYAIIAEDSVSITFSKLTSDCTGGGNQSALYRIVAGKKSLFLLGALSKMVMTDAMKQHWLLLLQSAHLEK